jgi:hypothetical protein
MTNAVIQLHSFLKFSSELISNLSQKMDGLKSIHDSVRLADKYLFRFTIGTQLMFLIHTSLTTVTTIPNSR